MRFGSIRKGKYYIVTITGIPNGQLDLTNIKAFKTKLTSFIPSEEKHLILDLEKVLYIDSAVIGLFVDLLNRHRNLSGSFGLVNVPKKVLNILELVNLTKFFPIYSSNEAVPSE
jgi:anti-sigma B factor antagonist